MAPCGLSKGRIPCGLSIGFSFLLLSLEPLRFLSLLLFLRCESLISFRPLFCGLYTETIFFLTGASCLGACADSSLACSLVCSLVSLTSLASLNSGLFSVTGFCSFLTNCFLAKAISSSETELLDVLIFSFFDDKNSSNSFELIFSSFANSCTLIKLI